MSKKKRASSRGAVNPLDLPVAKALQSVVADVQKTTQSVVKEVQKRIPADWNRNVRLIQNRLDRTATQADLQKLAKRVEDLTKQVEKLAGLRSQGSSAPARSSSPARRTAAAAKTRRTTRRTTKAAAKPAAAAKPETPPSPAS